MFMFLLFSMSLVGQALTGLAARNHEAQEHGGPAIELLEYVTSGDFTEAVFENWESEFLQITVFVVVTKSLASGARPNPRVWTGPIPWMTTHETLVTIPRRRGQYVGGDSS